jgi:hypothetical protein
MKIRLVPDWSKALRWWSVQLHLAATGFLAVYALVPSVPPEIAAIIPPAYRAPLLALWAVLGLAARVIEQRSSANG